MTTTKTYPDVSDGSPAGHKNRARDVGLKLTSTGSCPRRLVNKPHRGGV
jgi:hypothetical protein